MTINRCRHLTLIFTLMLQFFCMSVHAQTCKDFHELKKMGQSENAYPNFIKSNLSIGIVVGLLTTNVVTGLIVFTAPIVILMPISLSQRARHEKVIQLIEQAEAYYYREDVGGPDFRKLHYQLVKQGSSISLDQLAEIITQKNQDMSLCVKELNTHRKIKKMFL